MPLNLAAIAAVSRRDFDHRHIDVAAAFSISEVDALAAIRAADEAGYDTGRPREGKEKKRGQA